MLNRNYTIVNQEDDEEILNLANALASDVRIKILRELGNTPTGIMELAKKVHVSPSSILFHIDLLQKAKCVEVHFIPSNGRYKRMISRSIAEVSILFHSIFTPTEEILQYETLEIPIGSFTNANFTGETNGIMIGENKIFTEMQSPFIQDREKAILIWTSKGDIEYSFSNELFKNHNVEELTVSLELCSETRFFNNDWKSDVTFYINDVELCSWRCPGDFGGRRGKHTPHFWDVNSTQHGSLITITITNNGVTFNGELINKNVTLDKLKLNSGSKGLFRFGNKPSAEFLGGFNVFGKKCGDYPQDIIFQIAYKK